MATLHSGSCRYAIGDKVYVNYQAEGKECPYLEAGIIVKVDMCITSSLVDDEIVDSVAYLRYYVKLDNYPDMTPESYTERDVFQFENENI